MNKDMELVKCNLCESEDFNLLFEGHDYLYFSPLTFKLVKCSRCGLVFLNPRPKNIAQYYPERKAAIEEDVFLFLIPDRIKRIKSLKEKGRILDIGCGHGYFLQDMNKEGWDVYGNDLSETGCDFAKKKLGLKNIYNSDLLSLDLPENFFDVVTMWHTLEHMKKPKEILMKINQILKYDGILIIESPKFGSLQSRFFKEKWYSLDLPRHLYQFTAKILKKFLNLSEFEIYKRNYIVKPRINFISLKFSLLRWLGIRQIPNKEEIKETETVRSFRKTKILWRLALFVFNWICLLSSLFLMLINSGDLFRVYCKKIKRL